MKILIIDGLDKTSKSYSSTFAVFKSIITINVSRTCADLCSKCLINPEVLYRRYDDLNDFVFDWDAEFLDDNARRKAKGFDSLDMIFIIGNSTKHRYLPWNPSNRQLTKFLHLANICDKCVFICGSATFTGVYSLNIGAEHVDLLNLPLGDCLKELAAFPRYKSTKQVLVGCFLDNESGDLYTYNSMRSYWIPTCNVGCHRIFSNSVGSSSCPRQLWKDSSGSRISEKPLKKKQVLARVRRKHIQHYSVKGVDASGGFVVSMSTEWRLNNDMALPLKCGLQVLADSSRGPVLLVRGNILMITSDVDEYDDDDNDGHHPQSSSAYATVLANYIEHTMRAIVHNNQNHSSLYTTVFGSSNDTKSGIRPNFKSTEFEGTMLGQAMATIPVTTVVPGGPTLIAEQAGESFNVTLDALARTPPPPLPAYLSKSTQVETIVCRPDASRTSRLKAFVRSSGYSVHPCFLDKPGSIGMGLRSPRRPQSAGIATSSSNHRRRRESIGSTVRSAPVAVSVPRKIGWDVVLYSHNQSRPDSLSVSPRACGEKSRESLDRLKAFEKSLDRMLGAEEWDDGADAVFTDEVDAHPVVESVEATDPAVEEFVSQEQPAMPSPRARSKGLGGNPFVPITALSISQRVEASHLPVSHPRTGEVASSTVRLHSQVPTKPYSIATKLKAKISLDVENERQSSYAGAYREVFRTPFEREMFEKKSAGTKNLGGPFKTCFGKASELPLRAEGLVRPHGPYFGKTFHDCHPNQSPLDWVTSRREDVALRLAGPWKKS